jgi:hypothetical protein
MPLVCSCTAVLMLSTRCADLLHLVDHAADGLPGLAGQFDTAGHLFDAAADQLAISRAAPELRCASARTSAATTAKPAALFASTGCLDGGVQRQDVGLEGDAVDGADDLGHLA